MHAPRELGKQGVEALVALTLIVGLALWIERTIVLLVPNKYVWVAVIIVAGFALFRVQVKYGHLHILARISLYLFLISCALFVLA